MLFPFSVSIQSQTLMGYPSKRKDELFMQVPECSAAGRSTGARTYEGFPLCCHSCSTAKPSLICCLPVPPLCLSLPIPCQHGKGVAGTSVLDPGVPQLSHQRRCQAAMSLPRELCLGSPSPEHPRDGHCCHTSLWLVRK